MNNPKLIISAIIMLLNMQQIQAQNNDLNDVLSLRLKTGRTASLQLV